MRSLQTTEIGQDEYLLIHSNTSVPYGCDWCANDLFPDGYAHLRNGLDGLDFETRTKVLKVFLNLHGANLSRQKACKTCYLGDK